jgi:hypothetical protein
MNMSANGFREDELVSRRVKVGNEWQTKTFPIVAGRLRLAHEDNQKLNLQTELVNWDGKYAVFKCCAVTGKGQFIGYGTANAQRDARLVESLVELAETRSIARALRFAGYGMEYTGAEEVSHVGSAEPDNEQGSGKKAAKVFLGRQDKSELETNPPNGGSDPAAGEAIRVEHCLAAEGSMPQHCGIGQATSAQVRALFALTKRARYSEQDIQDLLRPLEASAFKDLSREDASRLITYLQTEVAA